MGNRWLLAKEYPLRDVSLPRDLGPPFFDPSCDACLATLDNVRGRTTGAGAGAGVRATADEVWSIADGG